AVNVRRNERRCCVQKYAPAGITIPTSGAELGRKENVLDNAGSPLISPRRLEYTAAGGPRKLVHRHRVALLSRSSSALICARCKTTCTVAYEQCRKIVTADNEPNGGLRRVYVDG